MWNPPWLSRGLVGGRGGRVMWNPPWTRGSNQLGKLIFDATPEQPFTYVWRVQEKDGIGVYGGGRAMYRAGELARKVLTDAEYDEFSREMGLKHPIPLQDFLPEEWDAVPKAERERLLFGFQRPTDAYEWFGPIHMTLMEQEGAELVRRKARRVFLSKSEKQLIFLPAD